MNNFNTNGSFTVIIASTGVAQPLVATSLRADRVDIQAAPGNAGNAIVGDSTITNDFLHGGIVLSASDVYNLEILKDLLPVYVVGTAGDKVMINWWIGDRN